MNKPNYKFLLLCVSILILSSFLLTGCTKDEEIDEVEEKIEGKVEVVDDVQEVEKVNDFSKENQEIGNLTTEVYEITSFDETSKDGFHRFVFEVEGERNIPNVTASFRGELGAIRLTFKSIEQDNSGIGYQNAVDIKTDGVVRIYHNITPNENEEIYDIGVSKETKFLLHNEKIKDGKWKIFLDVEYPGELDLDIDVGSEEFGNEEQIIEGAISSDGARITNYSFGVEGSVFRFIWTVRGSQEKPIPEVRARYNDDGEIVVVFPDLDSDYIGRDSNEVDLMGNVEKVIWQRIGKETIYRFLLKEKKEFRLSSSLSPNQVILEIKR